MEKRAHDVPLFGELYNVLGFEREHDHELCDDVCEFGDARVEEFQKVFQNVDVDKRAGISCGHLVLDRVLAAYGVELLEQRRRWLPVGVEQNVLEQSPHQVQVV